MHLSTTQPTHKARHLSQEVSVSISFFASEQVNLAMPAVSTRRCILDGEEIIIDITNGGESDEDCIRNSQGLIIVYSIAARSTFDAVSQLCYKIVEVKGVTAFSGIVAGNGSDLKYERQVGMNGEHAIPWPFRTDYSECEHTHLRYIVQRVTMLRNISPFSSRKRPLNLVSTSKMSSTTLFASSEIKPRCVGIKRVHTYCLLFYSPWALIFL